MHAKCPLCRAQLVAKPWPEQSEPATSQQATAIASWCENVAVRGVCDLMRASLPPLDAPTAASTVLRYLRGAGYAYDVRRVGGLFDIIQKASDKGAGMMTADVHSRNVCW